MSELNLQIQVTEINLQSALFPWPRMNTDDVPRLMSFTESVDAARSCSDGGCANDNLFARPRRGYWRDRNQHNFVGR